MDLFGSTFSRLEQSLNYTNAKNKAISTNIANVDTPNYKAKDVIFKEKLQEAMDTQLSAKRTNKRHIQFSSSQSDYKTITKKHTAYNHNGNNVDIDKEMSELAKNQINYQALVDRLNGQFNDLQTVIRGGS